MAIVALEGMRFFAYHGLFEEEKVQGNDFEVDVWLETGKQVSKSDQLEDAIDYGIIYKVVASKMQIRRDLLETLVAEIGEELRKIFEKVGPIRVRVTKFAPPVGGECRKSFVEDTF